MPLTTRQAVRFAPMVGALIVCAGCACGGVAVPQDAGADVMPTDAGHDAAGDATSCSIDIDGDGWVAAECGGDDCEDGDALIHPGALGTCDCAAVGTRGTETCDGLDEDCSGVADDADAVTACAGPHAVEACVAGACAVTSCLDGRLDCNGDPADGCEVDPETSREHCGTCGTACGFGCVAGACDEATQVVCGPGWGHTCVLRESRTVVCWGNNEFGQLGADPETVGNGSFVRVPLTGVVEIAAGYDFTCARRAGGDVVCFGANDRGQLGNGTFTGGAVPVSVEGIADATQIRSGVYHSCVMLGSGGARCWGRNADGELGDGTTLDRNVPVAPTGSGDFVSITAGGYHSCAIRVGGEVACWGDNRHGTLGDGTTVRRLTPTPVAGLPPIAELAGGDLFECALDHAGVVLCWGANRNGNVGDGTTIDRWSPVAVLGLAPGVRHIAHGNGRAQCVLFDGTVACWGFNIYGEVGDGTFEETRAVPALVAGLDDVIQIANGSHTCAIRRNGAVWCWGSNESGALGDGTEIHRSLPVEVVLPAGL
jgi:alpha-tubulin suppressor-like RCC1 family protein